MRDMRQLRTKYPSFSVKNTIEKNKEDSPKLGSKNKHKSNITYAEQLRLTLIRQYQTIKLDHEPKHKQKNKHKNSHTLNFTHGNAIDINEV